MKKVCLLAAALLSAAVLSACKGEDTKTSETENFSNEQEKIEITLWTYPIGNLGNPTSMTSLMSGFHKKYPNINISVEYLNYDNGDDRIEQALADGCAPDLVIEGPERLVANWGDRGLMTDISDLWNSPTAETIYENVKNACRHRNGRFYEFPICMTAHCMAINYDMFREAGALQYIDEEAHTWTTEGFIQAVHALRDYEQEKAGNIYCKNQSGDQGTRALVNNLYSGSFTDNTHTSYTIDTPENIQALQLLYDLEGITFEPEMTATEAIDLFCKKDTAMTFCWNVSMEIQHTITNPYLDFDVFPIAFPTSDGNPRLQGGIWGFGIFDSGDEQKIEAAKTFIRFMTEDKDQYTRIVRTSTYWPVRDLDNIYVNDELMSEYSVFTPYIGDYYQITPGWSAARTAWWKMLQEIGEGKEIAEAVRGFPAQE